MSKPNFFRFKRKFNNTNGEPTAKQAKKDGKNKGQTSISKFFLPSKQASNSNTKTKNQNVLKDLPESSVSTINTSEKNECNESSSKYVKRSTGLGKNTLDKLKKFVPLSTNAVSRQDVECRIGDKHKNEMTAAIKLGSASVATSNDTTAELHHALKSSTIRNEEKILKSISSAGSTKTHIKSSTETVKYTPFEQQIVELKAKYPQMILFVETGYKYRFFGNDAKIASEVLNIMANQDHNFLTASIPTHRLHVHVRRLVEIGHKVGVVKQTETTALKAKSATKSSIFSRELTSVFTKSTLIGEDVNVASSSQEENLGDSKVCSLACIAESPRCGKESNLCDIGIVILEPATGEAVFDSFVDLPNRAELEKRLEHTRPVEIIISQTVSLATEHLLSSSKSFRIEKLQEKCFDFSESILVAADFLTDEAKNRLGDLPPTVIAALAALLLHLQEFGLCKALNVQGLKKFTAENAVLQMDGGTVKNLELFETVLLKNKGSLCWTLDHTKTSFGSRLLQRWVSQPLCVLEPLLQRQDGVAEFLRPECTDLVQQVRGLLSKLPDLERDLTCILHGKSNTSSFASLVGCLSQLYTKLKAMEIEIWSIIIDEYIENLFKETIEHLQDVQIYEENLNFEAAKEGDKTKLFKNWSEFPKVTTQQEEISELLKKIDQLRPKLAKSLGMFSVNYTTVSGLEFLIELKNNLKVPSDWIKISSTKQVSRWRSPDVVALFSELCRHRELLAAACNEAWICTLSKFSQSYHTHKVAVQNLATLDVLMALAEVSKQDGFCRPMLKDDKPCIEIKNGKHPILTHLFTSSQEVVANDTMLGEPHENCMIITGPNMGGKSSYIRQVALIVIMAQIGCYVPAESATISLVDAIFTRMGSRDELHHGRSTLLVELEEACAILKRATPKSLAILDELGRGTSSCDGAALAVASLHYLIAKVRCTTLFVTHYPVVMTLEQQMPSLARNYHMAFRLHKDESSDEGSDHILTFLYHVEYGGADHSYGLNVARLAHIPSQILSRAAEKAQQLEQQVVASSQRCKNFQRMWKCCSVENLKENLKLLQN